MTGSLALKDGKMVMLRVPYPMGFYAKGLDGRIDDPNGGWKGRGLWIDQPATARRGSRKAAKAASRSSCTFRCAPIRSRTRRDDFCSNRCPLPALSGA